MTRIAQFMVQALFALNEKYFVSDKYTTRLCGSVPPAHARLHRQPCTNSLASRRHACGITSLVTAADLAVARNCCSRRRSLQTSLRSLGRALRQRENRIKIRWYFATRVELANRMLRTRRIMTAKGISARARFKEYTPCANPTFK